MANCSGSISLVIVQIEIMADSDKSIIGGAERGDRCGLSGAGIRCPGWQAAEMDERATREQLAIGAAQTRSIWADVGGKGQDTCTNSTVGGP